MVTTVAFGHRLEIDLQAVVERRDANAVVESGGRLEGGIDGFFFILFVGASQRQHGSRGQQQKRPRQAQV